MSVRRLLVPQCSWASVGRSSSDTCTPFVQVFFGQNGSGKPARHFEQVPDVAPNDFSDPVAYVEAREQRVREMYVAIENAKILREKVIDCYRKEGVNHIQICKPLREQYAAAIGLPSSGSAKYPTIPITAQKVR
jgi:hypothetical protein